MENKNFRPTIFWAWNNGMQDDRIRSEIAGFAKAGIGGLHLHARAGLMIDYLGEEWVHAYRTTIEECKKYGLDIWIYDENGWPSGFAGGKVPALGEDYRIKYLTYSRNVLREKGHRLLAAYDSARGYKRVSYEQADFFIYYDVQEHYADLLNPDVTEEFIKCTHEVYKNHFGDEFGKTVQGIFTDEPQIHVSSLAWSKVIPTEFNKKYGENVFDSLYLLFESEGEGYQEFRYKYYSLVRELFVKNYTERVAEWCNENGLLFTGHFAGEEGLCVQLASNTGVMPHYEYMSLPGIDTLGRKLNASLLLKQVQSVASQFGQKRILSETYACTGNGVSFNELAWLWNYQASFGVNMPCMSISMQSLGGVRKRDYPVFLSPQQPWWSEFKSFTDYMANTCEFVYEGDSRADVLVISAVNSALQEPVFSTKQKNVSARYRRLIEDLISLQITYDIGDENILSRHGKVNGKNIRVGNREYGIVVLPELDNISAVTIDLLETFATNGGRICCMTKLPDRVDGKKDSSNCERLKKLPIDIIQQRRGIIEKYFSALHYVRKIYVCDCVGKLAQNLIVNYRETAEQTNIILFNPSLSASVECRICALGSGTFIEYNPKNGKESYMPTIVSDGYCYSELNLSAKGCRYLRFVRGGKIPKEVEYGENVRNVNFKLTGIEDNLLVIDKAQYKFDDEEFSDKNTVVKILDEIYEKVEKRMCKSKIHIEYAFKASFKPERLFLVAESAKSKGISVNGNEIFVRTDEYYRDRDFRKYDISSFVLKGENKISMTFEIEPLNLGFDLKSAHDSVRNKFSYPVDVENVYILGDFKVACEGDVYENVNYISMEGGFRIEPKGDLPTKGDITANGYPFYAGNAVYEFTTEKDDGEIYVIPQRYYGACVSVEVNGEYAGTVFVPDDRLNITSYLKKGNNSVKMTLFGTLRNMLGPHHHFKGEPEYVGVHTFTGEYGNGAVEDLSAAESPDKVWTERYGVIRFGLEKIKILNKKLN